MARFFLVDQSLRTPGGHHLDFATCLAKAGNELGFDVVIGAHRDFQPNRALDAIADTRSIFSQTVYDSPSYLAGLQQMQRRKNLVDASNNKRPWWTRFSQSLARRKINERRHRWVKNFARDCDTFFRDFTFEEDDHVLFATVTELEWISAASFLARTPRTLQVNWHFLFHFQVFDGRPPDYARQLHRLRELKSGFAQAQQSTPYHRVNFYATTESLVNQYEKLQAGRFNPMAYPISDRFTPDSKSADSPSADSPSAETPLRIVCPGAIRREKRQHSYLQKLVESIWDRDLATGEVQLVLQKSGPKRFSRNNVAITFPQSSDESPLMSEGSRIEPIVLKDHPLPDDDYARMIDESDCGLLYYDADIYYARRAGILGELLARGRPVIVSAANWLSEQLKEAHFQYAAKLANGPLACRILTLHDTRCNSQNVPLPGGVISFDKSVHPFELEFDLRQDEGGVVLQFQWHCPTVIGSYCRIDVVQPSNREQMSQVIGHPENSNVANVFFRFPSDHAGPIRLRFSNAVHESSCSLKNVSLTTLGSRTSELPLTVLGLVVADKEQLPAAIAEMKKYRIHYRNTAAQFAPRWFAAHRAQATIGRMLTAAEAIRKTA